MLIIEVSIPLKAVCISIIVPASFLGIKKSEKELDLNKMKIINSHKMNFIL
jgi:hypothetical protein